jgi:hypothetical protein
MTKSTAQHLARNAFASSTPNHIGELGIEVANQVLDFMLRCPAPGGRLHR